MYKIFKTPDFDKYSKKIFQKNEILELEKFIEKLRYNPYLGKPLSYSFLREKRISDKRVYYLIYDDFCIILFVALSDKKVQQKIIDSVKINLELYKEYVKNLRKINTQ